MKREQQPDPYVRDCACGACPKLPTDRPATKPEVWAVVAHTYSGFWKRERMIQEAIDRYVWSYVSWVNSHGWRKPIGWDGQRRVARHELRPKGKGIFPEEARAMAQQLRAAAGV